VRTPEINAVPGLVLLRLDSNDPFRRPQGLVRQNSGVRIPAQMMRHRRRRPDTRTLTHESPATSRTAGRARNHRGNAHSTRRRIHAEAALSLRDPWKLGSARRLRGVGEIPRSSRELYESICARREIVIRPLRQLRVFAPCQGVPLERKLGDTELDGALSLVLPELSLDLVVLVLRLTRWAALRVTRGEGPVGKEQRATPAIHGLVEERRPVDSIQPDKTPARASCSRAAATQAPPRRAKFCGLRPLAAAISHTGLVVGRPVWHRARPFRRLGGHAPPRTPMRDSIPFQ
jgi:hypothetical protein